MSDAQAIAAVTSAISNLLTQELADPLAGGTVTVRPPDKARDSANLGNQLNLFLYGVTFNAAFRNADMPGRVRPGETAMAPLALTLHYMLTAYGKDDDSPDPMSHVLLGHAMRALHDHAILGPADLVGSTPPSDVTQQIERVRITPQTLSVEEMSKLWTVFQTQYRVSTGYQVSVVLIESKQPVRTPPPVLQRGQGDRGIASFTGTTSPLPSLLEARLPAGRIGAQIGDAIVLAGTSLQGTGHQVRLTHTRLGGGPVLALTGPATSTTLPFAIDPTASWAAGVYTVAVQLTRPGETTPRTSNEIPITVVPAVTVTPLTAPAGDVTITATVSPPVRFGQRASLLFGDREVVIDVTGTLSTLTATIESVPAGTYVVRLRVDGADSTPFGLTGTPPIYQFAANQTVTVT